MKKTYSLPLVEVFSVETEGLVCDSRTDYEVISWAIILGDEES